MPRIGRVVLMNYSHHVVQRGHNRQIVFAEAADYQRYIDDLREFSEIYGVKVYAYCLMTNHVHLLLEPSATASSLGLLMKALAARATRYRNRLEGRSGTLWESRYKSSVVQTERYLLACCRYIELNPVRARMVADAGEYVWSSYSMRMGNVADSWLDVDPCFLALGHTWPERQMRYAELMKQSVSANEMQLIREAVQRGQLTGSNNFIQEVERVLGLRVERRGQGRPKKGK